MDPGAGPSGAFGTAEYGFAIAGDALGPKKSADAIPGGGGGGADMGAGAGAGGAGAIAALGDAGGAAA
jgi:hypothetical protein